MANHDTRRPLGGDQNDTKSPASVALLGALRDRVGVVVTFGQHFAIDADIADLPSAFSPAWTRDTS